MKGRELLKHLRVVACFKSGRDLAERLSHADRIQREQREALLLAVDEIERLLLTDAEREALQFMLRHAAWACDQEAYHDSGDYKKHHDEVFRLMGRK